MSLYLILDLAAVIVPLAFSFHKRLEFFKLWKHLFLSIFIVGLFFVVWDWQFTSMGVWGFNPAYLTGIYFLKLPIEEYLFFICVPYASVFTFHVFRTLLPHFSLTQKQLQIFILVPAIVLFITGFIFYSKWYTSTTFLFAGISLFASYFYFRELLPHFILSYGAILIPFFSNERNIDRYFY